VDRTLPGALIAPGGDPVSEPIDPNASEPSDPRRRQHVSRHIAAVLPVAEHRRPRLYSTPVLLAAAFLLDAWQDASVAMGASAELFNESEWVLAEVAVDLAASVPPRQLRA
jgi:hypothetical protein